MLFKGDKINQVIEANNWYYDEVLNFAVTNPGATDYFNVGVDVGDKVVIRPSKIDVVTAALGGPAKTASLKCVPSGILCIDENKFEAADLKSVTDGTATYSVPLVAVGHGFSYTAVLKDGKGTMVGQASGNGDGALLFISSDIMTPREFSAVGNYIAVPATADGMLEVSECHGPKLDQCTSVDLPVTLPNVTEDELRGIPNAG
jgi:hypothetical protein